MDVILITGASRGIGAEVAMLLTDPERHIVVNYREKTRRANEVVESIRRRGGNASAAQADLCDENATAAMVDGIRRLLGRLDVLVLNASGGLERGAAPDYAMRINRDAQEGLVRLALPLMPVGGRIVFVTSHQAHFLGGKPVPADYRPIAVSKRAGEDALRAMSSTLESKGISLVVVSGDMIDGTTTVRLFEQRDPDAVAARRAVASLPTVSEFARAIVRGIQDVGEEMIYVGGPDYLPRRPATG